MTRDEALQLLGLDPVNAPANWQERYDSRFDELTQRLAAAPTDGLRAKYEAALAQLSAAHACLSPPRRPTHNSGAGLSRTQMADLPGAAPSYTRVGERSAGVQLGLQPGDVLANRYTIRSVLGRGGMGVVYEALDGLKRENIAIKVLTPEMLTSEKARERFLNEAKIACKLSHPNIVKVFDVGVSEPYYYLTMELLEGRTLRQQMDAQKLARTPFPVETILQYAQQLTGALEYAHRSIVHRDLKPENIWVEESGHLKLMDFGIARAFSNTELTRTGMAMGTAYYMAPEQLTGAKHVDGRADQYSLGVILYELLTGLIPQGAVQAPRAARSDVPAGASVAVMKALNPSPDGRFPDLAGFMTALQAKGLSAGARKVAVAMLAAFVLGAVVVTAWPYLKALMPDPAAQEEARVQALRLQGEIVELMRRVDIRQKEFEEVAKTASTALDRLNDKLLSARSEAERVALRAQLMNARANSDMAAARLTVARNVFRTDVMVELRGQQMLGETSLKEGRLVEAATALQAARTAIAGMLDNANAIGPFMESRQSFAPRINRARDIVQAYGGKADVVLGKSLATAADVSQHFDAGKVSLAADKLKQAGEELKLAMHQFLEQVAASYAQIAQQKMAANDLSMARVAIERAKAAEKLQLDYR